MCTYSRQTKPYIASRDMKVIKYLIKNNDTYRTPYQGTEVTLNTIIRPQIEEVKSQESYFENVSYSSGVLHSCFTTRIARDGNSIHVAIIPKGSKYWVGSNGEDICSDMLIITDETLTSKSYMFKETAEELMSHAPKKVGTIKDNLVLIGYDSEDKPLYACYDNIIENVAIDSNYNSNITNNFITESSKAIQDFAGIKNTEAFIKLEDSRFQLSNKLKSLSNEYYIPALGELHQLGSNLPFINASFALINKEPPFPFGWYWSSTEYSSGGSWSLGLGRDCPSWYCGGKYCQGSVVLFAKENTEEMTSSNITKDTIYVETERMAKLFRVSIKSMPNEAERTIGKDILITLRKIKFLALLSIKFNYYNSLYKELIKLKVMVDECLEDNLLLLKGKDNIIVPREKLMNICDLVESLVEPSSMKD